MAYILDNSESKILITSIAKRAVASAARGAPRPLRLQLPGAELEKATPGRGEVEWHRGELYPGVGFIESNLARPAERVVALYNQRGTAEQRIKEGKGAMKWMRPSCRSFVANAVHLQLRALAYNLGNSMRTLAMPKAAKP